jgi:hypothetical protein
LIESSLLAGQGFADVVSGVGDGGARFQGGAVVEVLSVGVVAECVLQLSHA